MFTEFLSARHTQHFGISLMSLFESALAYLVSGLELPFEVARDLILSDYRACGKIDFPKFLRLPGEDVKGKSPEIEPTQSHLPKRQQRHLGNPQT